MKEKNYHIRGDNRKIEPQKIHNIKKPKKPFLSSQTIFILNNISTHLVHNSIVSNQQE